MRTWGLVGILLALPVGLRGQAPEKEVPVFTSAVDIVAVDVNVVDSPGRPLRGLAPGDFTLTVEGKPRTIVSVEYVDLGGDAQEEEEKKIPAPSPYFATNEGVPRGRLLLIVVDQGQIQQGGGRQVVRAADGLLDRFGPGDRTGLITIPPPGPNVEFTADHAKVRDALTKVTGRGRIRSQHLGLVEALAYPDLKGYAWQAAVSRECGQIQNPTEQEICTRELETEAQDLASNYRAAVQGSIASLRALFDAMKTIEGPKTLLLITEGLSDVAEGVATWRDLATRAAEARVSLYVLRLDMAGSGFLDATGPRPPGTESDDEALRRGGVGTLAGLARGAVFNVVGSAETAFDRIARELTGYYLLGFEPEPGDRDGKDRPIRVQVDRKNVTIRARGSLTIPQAGKEPKDEERLAHLLTAPFPATDLGVRVAAYSLSMDKGRVRVIVSAEVERARGGLAVGFALVDGKGKMAGSGAGRLGKPGESGPAAFVGATTVEPGVYTLKVAALDAAGRAGTVAHTVKAAVVAAGGLELSDLLVGAPPTKEESFRPAVGLAAEGGLVARVEMAGKDPARLQKAAVAVEIAEAADGPALVRVPAHTADSPEGDRRMAEAGLSLGMLPPGDYVVRAVVSVDGKAVGALTRPLHFEPSASGTKQASLSIEGLATSIGRFEVADVLQADVLGHFLDRTAKLVPGPPSAEVQLALERARKGDAAGILDVLPAVGQEEVRFVFLRGIGLLAKGQVAPASTQFRKVLELSSEFFPAAFYLGACYAATDEDRQAAGAWQTALVRETGHPIVYRLLADALLRVAEPQEALRIAEEGLARWPDDDGLRRRLGLAYAMTGRRGEALTTLTGYVEHHPQDAGAVFVTLRLLFDAFSADRAGSPPEERQRMIRYARSYVEARGPNQEIVARWLRYLEKDTTP